MAGFSLLLWVSFAPGLPPAEAGPVPASAYVEEALSRNPSLASMRERIRMKENAEVRAGALDDPKARLGVTNLPTRSWSFREEEMTGKEIGLSQMFPFPGKLRLKREAAGMEKEQSVHDLEEMRNMLRSEIRMTYAELASIRRQAEVVRRTREVLRDIVGVTQEMYSVGKGSQPDVLRGQVESGKMREMLLLLENREKVLSVRLNALAALPANRPVPELEDLSEFAIPWGQDGMTGIYRENRPARKAARARIGRGGARVEMARREYWPDFEASVSYMQRDAMPDGAARSDMISSMVMVNLPLWRRQKLDPQLREMTAEKEMAARDLEALDLAAEDEIGRILANLANRAEVAALYRTTLIPQAEQSFRANVESYQVGRIDFPMLMDSVMTVLSFRREYLAMVGEMHME
ncbi:MAG TPA: TolC family protein, partial [Candidatus Deferrimicrobiaceae bacterium]|nr:TolC family protein [Candidatus Deferrimicrobiaceae bacterium]